VSRPAGGGRPGGAGEPAGPRPAAPDGERPPLLGSWGGWYALVVGELLLVILLLAWLTRALS
jgi:hypothetical protein